MGEHNHDPFLRDPEHVYAVAYGAELAGDVLEVDPLAEVGRRELAESIRKPLTRYGTGNRELATVSWLAAVRAIELAEEVKDVRNFEHVPTRWSGESD